MSDIKQNLTEQSIWKRGLFMVFYAICYSVAEIVMFAVVIFQFLVKLITGETNDRLQKLGQSLATYIYQIVQYLNFNSERAPYPYNPWPKQQPQEMKKSAEKPPSRVKATPFKAAPTESALLGDVKTKEDKPITSTETSSGNGNDSELPK